MIKKYDGFSATKTSTGREILPAGGYVCEIKSSKQEVYSWGSRLVLMIEVAEGEYKDFWRRDYDQNTNEDRKWRGVYRISLPKDDGSEQDAWTKRSFNNFIYSVQESNPGYVWAWDETTLKGKKIGVLYRNREWEMNGRTGWTTEAAGAVTVEDCRAGKFRLPKDRPLTNRPEPDAPVPVDTTDNDDLPF